MVHMRKLRKYGNAMCAECLKMPSCRIKWGLGEEFRCSQCGELRLAREYHTKNLENLLLNGKEYEARCLRCDPSQLERFTKDLYKCCACKEELPKERFSLARAKSHKAAQRRCELCERPPCRICAQRPAKPLTNQNEVIHTPEDRLAYRCQGCKYPPCEVCGTTPREKRAKHTVDNLPNWVCSRCKGKEEASSSAH